MIRLKRCSARSIAPLLLIGALSACAGGLPPPDSTPSDAHHPPGSQADPAAPQAEIYGSVQRLVIDEFRVDFAEVRNVYALVGFYPDQWDRMDRVALDLINEFEIRGEIDDGTFERIFKNREEFQLKQQEIFKVYVRLKEGNAFDYYAIIPRIRGFKDGQRWEQPMAGNPLGIDRVVIRTRR